MGRALRHRLRNSASGMKAATSLLASLLDSRLTPSEREYFPLIAKECDALAEVASRLSLLFENTKGGMPGQVVRVLKQARQSVQARYPLVEIQCELEQMRETATVGLDACLLLALKEVLANAAEVSSNRQVHIHASCSANAVEIRVRDHGPGLSPEDWQKAVRPFGMARADRLGIGLAMATQSMAALGGTLQARKGADGFDVILAFPPQLRD